LPHSEQAAATFRLRQKNLAERLARAGLFACVIEDFEHQRTGNLRWLSGHPMDALLFVFATGKTVLVPWDVLVAEQRGVADQVIPYAEYRRSARVAVMEVLRANGVPAEAAGAGPRPRIGFPERTSHLRYQELLDDLPGAEVVLRADGFESLIGAARLVKDEQEVRAVEKAAEITNTLIGMIERLLESPRDVKQLRELDLAQLVEREALSLGAEGMGFETLAAGPLRSWAIHPFPAFSREPFGSPGLSILDFGVKVDGYTSDVTLTVARGRLSAEQERMVGLVERAYAAAMEAAGPGVSPQAVAEAADSVFAVAGWKMPHSLGHGIGLDTHEPPILRSQKEGDVPALLPGMVVTVEPGLYHPEHGGVRWENDVLITKTGPRVLTKARIIRVP
jgi:Xaa-Pro dipeptidase